MKYSHHQPLIYLLVLILVVLCSSCGGDDEDCFRPFGEEFRIEEGDELCLSDGSTLIIDEFTNSYCLCFENCLWEGEANVNMRRLLPDGTTEDIQAHEILVEKNPEWLEVSRVVASTDCIPLVEEIFIRLRF